MIGSCSWQLQRGLSSHARNLRIAAATQPSVEEGIEAALRRLRNKRGEKPVSPKAALQKQPKPQVKPQQLNKLQKQRPGISSGSGPTHASPMAAPQHNERVDESSLSLDLSQHESDALFDEVARSLEQQPQASKSKRKHQEEDEEEGQDLPSTPDARLEKMLASTKLDFSGPILALSPSARGFGIGAKSASSSGSGATSSPTKAAAAAVTEPAAIAEPAAAAAAATGLATSAAGTTASTGQARLVKQSTRQPAGFGLPASGSPGAQPKADASSKAVRSEDVSRTSPAPAPPARAPPASPAASPATPPAEPISQPSRSGTQAGSPPTAPSPSPSVPPLQLFLYCTDSRLTQKAIDTAGWTEQVEVTRELAQAHVVVAAKKSSSGRHNKLKQGERTAANSKLPFVCVGRKMTSDNLKITLGPLLAAHRSKHGCDSGQPPQPEGQAGPLRGAEAHAASVAADKAVAKEIAKALRDGSWRSYMLTQLGIEGADQPAAHVQAPGAAQAAQANAERQGSTESAT
ncbi:hypothetical protein QJQ45_001733 [Haematococcus lacustris]|nr:hypothetical protein QJQ45_001733 [Haematococcus lacustris]